MCLLLIAWRVRDDYPLILAANRDEFYARPSAAADFWDDEPDILAGRDLQEGGTWLGITKAGRIAALTNYRDPAAFKSGAPSRGGLVSGYLRGKDSPERYLEALGDDANHYNGFNLIVGNYAGLYYFSNRGARRKLEPGIYGMSNSLLDVPWPKVLLGKKKIASLLASRKMPTTERLFKVLYDRSLPPDDQLSDTGVGLKWERILSPLFIQSPDYGTRSSTALLVDKSGKTTFSERVYDASGVFWMTSLVTLTGEDDSVS
jgi:uncharacterized protein with NRDE domain